MIAKAAQLNTYRSVAELRRNIASVSHNMNATTNPSHMKWSSAALIA
jgi:hypothetical protein